MLALTARPPVPVSGRCAKSVRLHRAAAAPPASQRGGRELLHPPLCQDGGLDGLQLRARLGAVQGRVRGGHRPLGEKARENLFRCGRVISETRLYEIVES